MRRSVFAGSDARFFRLAPRLSLRAAVFGFVTIMFGFGFAAGAAANPAIVVDAATGDVLYAEQATQAWYPASLTKLMTFYVALSAVRDHKISFDTPIMISPRASRAAPSKMGFKPGTEVTLGNALKMLVVKSANDIAIAVAEAVSGSVDAFAEDMNASAAKLGMDQSHFDNPNGLPDPDHVSSAHDMAVLARAIYLNFPKAAEMFDIGALRLGDQIIPTHNNLLGRYPGVDGMKTGFTCAAGFNLVASAERDGHHYIAVVLGAPTPQLRMLKIAVLLDRAFDGIDHPEGKLDALDRGSPGAAPDMHNMVCRRRGKAAAAFKAEIAQLEAPLLAMRSPAATTPGALALFNGAAALRQLQPVAPTIGLAPRPVFDPVSVYVGPAPGYQGPVAEARPPHSPVGTPAPPEAASAYVPTNLQTLSNLPLKPDIAALPLKRRHVAHHAAKRAHHRLAKAKAKKTGATAGAAAATHLTHASSHAGKAKTAAAKGKQHLHKHVAQKIRAHRVKSTELAAKPHASGGAAEKTKHARLTTPAAQ